jgi:hypothetical protein
MSNRNARILAAGGAAVLVAALGSPAALAAPTATTWTVQPGGAITATSGSLTLTNPPSGSVSDTCTLSTMSGTLKAGSGLPGPGIGSISMAAFRGCGHIASQDLKARGLPWHLNLVSYDAATGVSRGTISHLKIAFAPAPGGCTAVVNGTSGSNPDGVVAVTYANQTGKLKIHPAGGTLHFYHITGCAGLLRDGDTATLSATFTVSPKQDITSP